MLLGDQTLSSALAGSRKHNIYMDSSESKHVDQSINAKEIDPAANEIADPRLSHSKQFSRFRLSKTSILDELSHRDHQARADSKVLGFSLAKAQISKDVPARRSDLRVHGLSTSDPATRFQAISQDVPIPLPRKLDVSLGSLPRSLLKSVQNVDSFFKLRHVEDSMLQVAVDAQLVNARSHGGHGLPVSWLKPFLNQVKLMAGHTPRSIGEGSQVLQGGAYPEELFHGRARLYNFQYVNRIREPPPTPSATPTPTPTTSAIRSSRSADERPDPARCPRCSGAVG